MKAGAALTPILVSQANCLAAVGMVPRRYLETLRALKIPHIADGALRLCDPAVFVVTLEAARKNAEETDAADAVRQRLGKRRGVAGGTRG